MLKMRRKFENQREKKKKRKKRNLRYVIQCLLYEKIYIHRVIERNEFSSWIDVDHRDAQNKASHNCWWVEMI
jgi:hypothetical protein